MWVGCLSANEYKGDEVRKRAGSTSHQHGGAQAGERAMN